MGTPRSFSIFLSHTASHATTAAPLYLASILERATVSCFLLLQEMVHFRGRRQNQRLIIDQLCSCPCRHLCTLQVELVSPTYGKCHSSLFHSCILIVERQAQHWPDRLKKPRTGLLGTDRLGRVRKPVRRLVCRKAGSVQKPGGRWKDIP